MEEALIAGRPRKHALMGSQRHSSATIGRGSFSCSLKLLQWLKDDYQMTSYQKKSMKDFVSSQGVGACKTASCAYAQANGCDSICPGSSEFCCEFIRKAVK